MHPGQLFIQRGDALVKVYRCTEFGVSSLIFHYLLGSHAYKVFPLRHFVLVPVSTGNHIGTCLPIAAIGPRGLSRVRQLVWSAALKIRSSNSVHVHSTCTCTKLFLQLWHHHFFAAMAMLLSMNQMIRAG